MALSGARPLRGPPGAARELRGSRAGTPAGVSGAATTELPGSSGTGARGVELPGGREEGGNQEGTFFRPAEKSLSVWSLGGSIVARQKLEGIDGRAPQEVDSVA